MNLLDNIEKHVEFMTANTQGHIFEYASELDYNLEEFVTEYMKSDFCNQEMDSDYSMFQNEVDTACMEVILKEFSKKGITIQSDPEHHYRFCAFYTGFVYRYLQLLSRKSSKELISIIPFSKMAMNYYLDHYEYKDAIKTICEREKMNLGIVIDW